MNKRSRLGETLRLLTYVTQLGVSVISPIVLCVLVGVWLSGRFGIGPWLIVVLLFIGLVSGGCGFYRFVRMFTDMEKRIPPHDGEGEWENED